MRYAADISESELLTKLDDALVNNTFDRHTLNSIGKIGNDISKVSFDFENYEYNAPYSASHSKIVGPKRFGNLSVIGVVVGGDWEYPVHFFIYLDKNGKTLRAYIPRNGNPWNKTNKSAFGNDDESDKKEIERLTNKKYDNDYFDIDDAEIAFDQSRIIADLVKRVIVNG